MSFEADRLLDRRRLRRSLTRWRVLAAVLGLAALGILGARLAGPRGPAASLDHIARLRVSGFIGEDAARLKLFDEVARSGAKAVVLHVDSPGGGAAASEGLYEALRRLNAKKPVVAVVDGLAASGGYIAAIAADHIVARRASFVGSIGVIIQYPNFGTALDRLGVKVEEVKSSPLKAEPNGFKETSPEARAALQAVVADSYAWFRDLVRERRGLDEAALARVADGRVFTGGQGVELKLVDRVGGEAEGLAWLKEAKGIDTALPVRDWPGESPWQVRGLPFRVAAALGLGSAARFLAAAGDGAEAAASPGLLTLWRPAAD